MQMEPTAVKGEDFPLPALAAFTLWRSEPGHSVSGETGFAQASLCSPAICWWALSAPR